MASIRPRGSSYQITVSRGYDVYGKKQTETTTFTPDPGLSQRKREQAVREFAMDFERRIKNGFAMDGRKITLLEFSQYWMENCAKVDLQPGTVANYSHELKDNILPALGHLKLTQLRPHLISALYKRLLQDGARHDGKPGGYSPGSIHKTHNVLSSILRTAVQWELIDQNPCGKVKVPSAPNTADNIKFFTPRQTAVFLNYIEQPYQVKVSGHKRIDDTGKSYSVGNYVTHKTIPLQLRVLFNLAVYTGMRKGELLALTWDDIDTEHDTINVTKSVTIVNKVPCIKVPKTKTSYRTISVPHFLTVRLQNLHKEQEKFKKSAGDYWKGDNWVFTQDKGYTNGGQRKDHAFQRDIFCVLH